MDIAICFKCANIETAVKQLKDLGLRVLSELQPREAFDNEKIAFVYAKQGLNVKLIDTGEKARLIGTFSKEKPWP